MTDYTSIDIERMLKRIERLSEFVEDYVTCPCCHQTRICVDDCTFAEDASESYFQMMSARDALYGE